VQVVIYSYQRVLAFRPQVVVQHRIKQIKIKKILDFVCRGKAWQLVFEPTAAEGTRCFDVEVVLSKLPIVFV